MTATIELNEETIKNETKYVVYLNDFPFYFRK